MWDVLAAGGGFVVPLAIGVLVAAGALSLAVWCAVGSSIAATVELSRGREHEI
jgi:hypothetical protein